MLARISHQPSRQLLHALLYPEASDRRYAGPTECRPQHPCSRTATTLCRTLHVFHSVRALNIVSTMLAHPPNNDCRLRQSLLGVVAKDMQGTTFRRLATNGGEKCGLDQPSFRTSTYRSNRRPILSVRILDCYFPIPERKNIAAGNFHPLAVSLRPRENPFRHSPVSNYEMMCIGPAGIREVHPGFGISCPNCFRSLVAGTTCPISG